MKFSCHVDIHLPRHKVVELFDNPDNLKQWQDGFISMEHISGERAQAGSEYMMLYQMGKRKMKIKETILVNNLPEEFTGLYEHKHMDNTMQSLFEEIDSNNTRYTSHVHYTRFSGFMPKLIAFIAPGMFKKQVLKWMNQFKTFAESTTS